jgi:hypothetical protein
MRQTEPCQHVIVEDKVGLGVGGMYRDIQNHVHKVTGDYVLVLSDDNCFHDDEVVEDLKRFVFAQEATPEVVIWRGSLQGILVPKLWGQRPKIAHIDLSNFVVRRDIWTRHADDWPDSYEGDYHFIAKLWDEGYRFDWMQRDAYYAMRISGGAPE